MAGRSGSIRWVLPVHGAQRPAGGCTNKHLSRVSSWSINFLSLLLFNVFNNAEHYPPPYALFPSMLRLLEYLCHHLLFLFLFFLCAYVQPTSEQFCMHNPTVNRTCRTWEVGAVVAEYRSWLACCGLLFGLARLDVVGNRLDRCPVHLLRPPAKRVNLPLNIDWITVSILTVCWWLGDTYGAYLQSSLRPRMRVWWTVCFLLSRLTPGSLCF